MPKLVIWVVFGFPICGKFWSRWKWNNSHLRPVNLLSFHSFTIPQFSPYTLPSLFLFPKSSLRVSDSPLSMNERPPTNIDNTNTHHLRSTRKHFLHIPHQLVQTLRKRAILVNRTQRNDHLLFFTSLQRFQLVSHTKVTNPKPKPNSDPKPKFWP